MSPWPVNLVSLWLEKRGGNDWKCLYLEKKNISRTKLYAGGATVTKDLRDKRTVTPTTNAFSYRENN